MAAALALLLATVASALPGVDGEIRVVRTGGAKPMRTVSPRVGARVAALDEKGRVVAETTTDKNGRFRLTLPPGTYRLEFAGTGTTKAPGLTWEPKDIDRGPTPSGAVTVADTRARVTVEYREHAP